MIIKSVSIHFYSLKILPIITVTLVLLLAISLPGISKAQKADTVSGTKSQIHDTVKSDSTVATSSYISKNELLAIGRLNVDIENFDFDFQFTIISYEVLTTSHGFTRSLPNKGPEFSPQTKQLIMELQRGDKIYFENIKVLGSDGLVRTIDPLVLIIK